MARIRTVKPEFWTDEVLGEVSPSARLAFIATWTFADDHGNLERSARQLKAQAFPYDAIDVEPLLAELLAVGLLVEYEVDGKKFMHIKGFGRHQKVENPSKPRHPLPDFSGSPHREVTEDSPGPQLWKGKGKGKGKGVQRETVDAVASPAPPPTTAEPPPAELDLAAWDRWVSYRRQVGKAIKPASSAAAQRKLASFGLHQAAVVEQSIANGWQGLFALKASGPPGRAPVAIVPGAPKPPAYLPDGRPNPEVFG